MKAPILQEDMTVLCVCVSNNRAINYRKQKLIEMQKEIEKSTIMVETVIASLLKIEGKVDRKSSRK